MSGTGYAAKRAAPHEEFCGRVQAALYERGWEAQMLEPDGDGPDIRLSSGEYIEVKTREPGKPNYAIKLGCIDHARSSPDRIYFLFDNGRVNTVDTLNIVAGPFRPNGNGSNTDYLLVHPHTGTPFKEFFS